MATGKGDDAAKVKRHPERPTSIKFAHYHKFMCDITETLQMLSKPFQEEDLLINNVSIHLEAVLMKLIEFKSTKGEFYSNFLEHLEELQTGINLTCGKSMTQLGVILFL